MLSQEQLEKLAKIGEIYTPSYPVEIQALFSGRLEQFQNALSVVNQKGLHAIIYGDRGVGKTSLSNILKIVVERPELPVVKVSCSSEDTFENLWKNILDNFEITIQQTTERASFIKDPQTTQHKLSLLTRVEKSSDLTVSKIVDLLKILNGAVIIIDEFDRLEGTVFNKKTFTDIIKAISDSLPSITVIIVGVSEDISTLINEHESIERNLRQIYMPTMSAQEIIEIIVKGEDPLGIKFKEEVKNKIVELSSGYPHFAHALCYYSLSTAILANSNFVDEEVLKIAVKQTLDNAHESLRNAYRVATLATKKNIFSEVLLAASKVSTDEYGYFQANDLEPFLTEILNEKVKVNNFVFHLGKFCTTERGEILRTTGTKNRQRYKFKNPLMRAFIRLKLENDKSANS